MRKASKAFLATSLLILILFGLLLYLAKSDIKSVEVGSLEYETKMYSRSLLIQLFGAYKNTIDKNYGAHLFDNDFEWEDLTNSYFDDIRKDERLAHLYEKPHYDITDYIEMREFLRDFFSHGKSNRKYLNANLIELLDAAEKGEQFACGDISKMLAQMIMATGTQARLIRLSNKKGNGHVVVEFWSNKQNKWVLLDPDYNVHYTDPDGLFLNARDLYAKAQNNEIMAKHKGKSINTLFDENETKLFERFYSNGFAVDCYNKWISKNYEKNNPQRSPVNTCIYIGEQKGRERYYAKDFDLEDEDYVKLLYKNPILSK